jgi:hypothetical protein
MEADRILGREAAQAGESFVKADMVKKYRVGSDKATVVEDPTIPGSYGYYLFDDEGVPARPRYLYKEGIIYDTLNSVLSYVSPSILANTEALASIVKLSFECSSYNPENRILYSSGSTCNLSNLKGQNQDQRATKNRTFRPNLREYH